MLRHFALRIANAWAFALTACCVTSFGIGSADAADIEGFTEPYREIAIASAETGILTKVDVSEGDQVHEGQLLAELNQDVLRASLRVAEKYKESKGQLVSARADLRLRTERLDNLKKLLEGNHASPEEIDRAATEKAIAEAQVLAITESIQVKELECERAKAQLEQRFIRSPVDGFVKQVSKYIGEFVAPTDPVVLTVVQLDPLLATFAVPAQQTEKLAARQQVQLRIGGQKATVSGTVKSISPVVDAQSGTVRVRVEFPNPDGRFRSGNPCVLVSPDGSERVTRRP